jgi:RNA polymerase sigma factor (sigma-70 family)
MASTSSDPTLRHIRRLIADHGVAIPDRDFLERYLERRDEAAFTALVERHGPMVFGLCQALLHHRHDAEDAFQATFLVLARKAGSIRRREALASWLHGVAYRVARKAIAAGARRRALEAKAARAAPGVSTDDLRWGEVRAILHAELAALPKRLREPLVLCYLQGSPQEDAAQRLGCSAAALKGRLQRGRSVLRRRLERRGIGLAATLGAAALAGQTLAAPMPLALVKSSVRFVFPVAGETAAPAPAALAHDAMRPIITVPRAAIGAVLLMAVAVAGGVMVIEHEAGNDAVPPLAKPAREHREPRVDAFGDPLPEGALARLGTVRFNHGDGLNSLHFSPDGHTIISEGAGTVRLWDAATGKESGHFATPEPSWDEQTALSQDGKTMISLNQEWANDTVRTLDLAQGKQLRKRSVPAQRNVMSVDRRNAISPDGRSCALLTSKQVKVVDSATGRDLCKLAKRGDEVQAVVFAGNNWLVTADKAKFIDVWEARSGKPVRRFAHGTPVGVLVASVDGRRLATVEHHNHAIDRLLDRDVVHVWDLKTGTHKLALAARPKRWYMNARFSPNGKRLITSSFSTQMGELTIWDLDTGARLRELPGASGNVLAISPDSTRLAAGALPGKFDLWELESGRRLSSEDSKHATAAAVFLSPTGDRAFTIGYSSITSWAAMTGRRLHSFDVPPFFSSMPYRNYSPDGRYAVTYSGDFEQVQIHVWHVATGRRLHTLAATGQSPGLQTTFAPDSSFLATLHPGKETLIRTWDLKTGKELRSFKENEAGWPWHLFFSVEGKTLLVAGKQIIGREVRTGKELFCWRMVPIKVKAKIGVAVGGRTVNEDERLAWRTLTVSPDGKLLACIFSEPFGGGRVDDRLALFEARTGRILLRWSDSGRSSRSYEQLSFSHDGRFLASSDGNVVHLWEVATGKEVRVFDGHQGEIESLAFSANDRRLASASTDSTVLIWEAVPAARGDSVLDQPSEKDLTAWWADLAGRMLQSGGWPKPRRRLFHSCASDCDRSRTSSSRTSAKLSPTWTAMPSRSGKRHSSNSRVLVSPLRLPCVRHWRRRSLLKLGSASSAYWKT